VATGRAMRKTNMNNEHWQRRLPDGSVGRNAILLSGMRKAM